MPNHCDYQYLRCVYRTAIIKKRMTLAGVILVRELIIFG